jgi:23S rRNA (uracil1939-C5)-methyltransferase
LVANGIGCPFKNHWLLLSDEETRSPDEPTQKLLDPVMVGAGGLLKLEINTESVKLALKNQKINSVENAKFIIGDVERQIEKLSEYKQIILDPPRSGLTTRTINALLKNDLKQIIYLSCNLITLKRDLKRLQDKYDIKLIQPYDMFPNTPHIEIFVQLNPKI